MSQRSLSLALVILLAPSTLAQVSTEGFDSGNPDGWELWFSPYNTLKQTGGNPGSYLELDNFNQGPASCHFIEAFPAGNAGSASYAHSGNWRAAGVTDVSVDLSIVEGIYQGDVRVELVSDPGTPADDSDDCIVFLNLPGAGSSGSGWQTYSFVTPSVDTTLPPGWEVDSDSPCVSGSSDAAWNTVIEDVDQIRFVYDGFPPAFCNFTNWILGIDNIVVNGPVTTLGTNYCAAAPNSTGVPATMSGVGTNVASSNNVTLTCSSMPASAFGFFLTGMTQGFVQNPGGSSGNLCLSGSIGRYVGPGQIQNSGPLGEFSLALDLSQHPTPSALVQVMGGETWNFTCWFRDLDMGGSVTSNFSDGYSIVFM